MIWSRCIPRLIRIDGAEYVWRPCVQILEEQPYDITAKGHQRQFFIEQVWDSGSAYYDTICARSMTTGRDYDCPRNWEIA